MKKKFVLAILVFVFSMFIIPNVHAQEADAGELANLLSSGEQKNIELKPEENYQGDFTINHDVTIVGNGATIKGTIKITGGTEINISDLTMTGHVDNSNFKDDPYIEVKSNDVKLNLSKVTIYNGVKDDSSSFIYAGSGVKVPFDVTGSEVTINDSTIQTKYAVWMQGADSDLTIKNSKLSGYAALDLTSSEETSNNKVTINNSTLTGYALYGNEGDNDYGTIVVGNKKNVTIDIINNSIIANNFDNSTGARNDLILISDHNNTTATAVTVNVEDSTLNNTAKSVSLGAVYNANGMSGISFKTKNITAIGNLIAGEDQFYVDFVIDGKSNIVLVPANGEIDPSNIPDVYKAGYTFDGWFNEAGSIFSTKGNITKNLTVNARFTKIPASNSKTDNIENPDTLDGISSSVVLGIIGLIGIVGCAIYYKKIFQ